MQRITINEDEYTASDYTTSTDSNTLSTSDIPSYFSNENPHTPIAQPIQSIPTVISSMEVSCVNDHSISPISSSSPVRNRFRYFNYDIESLEEEESFHSMHSFATIDYLRARFKLFTFSTTLLLMLCHFIDIGGDNVYDNYNLMMGVISPWPECKDNRSFVWKLFSNILVHSNNIHLLGNVFMFFIFSYLLEQYQYSSRIASVFVMGVIHGNLILYYVQPYSYGIGASHGSFTMLGAFLSNLVINNDIYSTLYIFGSTLLVFIFILNESLSYNESNNIAYISHWTGCVSGFTGGISILKHYHTTRFKNTLRLLSLTIYIAITISLFYNYGHNYPPLQSYNNVFQKVDNYNCCYKWFQYKHVNNSAEYKDFQCQYTIHYDNFIFD